MRINNYALAQRALGIKMPAIGDYDRDAIESYWGVLAQKWQENPSIYEKAWISGGQVGIARTFHQFEHLGFDIRNVAQSIIAGRARPLEMVTGTFDPDRSQRALQDCHDCLTPEIGQNGTRRFYIWGDDGKGNINNEFAPPAFDRLGRGGNILVSDDLVLRAIRTDQMHAIIDAEQKEISTLRDVPEFRMIAESMADSGAYVLLISNDVEHFHVGQWLDGRAQYLEGVLRMRLGPDAEAVKEYERKQQETRETLSGIVRQAPLLRPYSTIGLGGGVDDGEVFMVLALVHDDPELAKQNKGILAARLHGSGHPWMQLSEAGTPEYPIWLVEETWAETFDVDGVETMTSGPMLKATIRGDFRSVNWYLSYNLFSVLLVYE